MRSASSLRDRPAVRPPTPPREAWEEPPAPGPALPAPCLRALAIGDRAGPCFGDCPGHQGGEAGCLAEIVRARPDDPPALSVDEFGYWHVEEG